MHTTFEISVLNAIGLKAKSKFQLLNMKVYLNFMPETMIINKIGWTSEFGFHIFIDFEVLWLVIQFFLSEWKKRFEIEIYFITDNISSSSDRWKNTLITCSV